MFSVLNTVVVKISQSTKEMIVTHILMVLKTQLLSEELFEV